MRGAGPQRKEVCKRGTICARPARLGSALAAGTSPCRTSCPIPCAGIAEAQAEGAAGSSGWAGWRRAGQRRGPPLACPPGPAPRLKVGGRRGLQWLRGLRAGEDAEAKPRSQGRAAALHFSLLLRPEGKECFSKGGTRETAPGKVARAAWTAVINGGRLPPPLGRPVCCCSLGSHSTSYSFTAVEPIYLPLCAAALGPAGSFLARVYFPTSPSAAPLGPLGRRDLHLVDTVGSVSCDFLPYRGLPGLLRVPARPSGRANHCPLLA